jgi:hypothetical protein
LRRVATGCSAEDVAALYYNWACFEDMLASLGSIARLSLEGAPEGRLSPSGFQIYIFLSELIARDRISDPQKRARFLNQGYGQALEVAEMRLKRYDPKPDRLERR